MHGYSFLPLSERLRRSARRAVENRRRREPVLGFRDRRRRLLTGSDFIAALKGNVYGDFVVLPSECMVGDDYLFLDDLTIKDVQDELGVEVVPSGYDARDFVREITRRAI